MKRIYPLLPLILMACAPLAQAQLYKWTGPDGKVNYTDTPPPKEAQKVETKSATYGSGPSEAGLPFELAEAVRNHPVTLYTNPKCAPCDAGRNFLKTRGIPFVEKTVTSADDIAKLRQIGGETVQVPLLLVGRNKHSGYDSNLWGPTLTVAGYPETSKLPANYKNGPVEAAAPSAKAPEKTAKSAPPPAPAESLPPAVGNAPPGFRF